MVAPLHASQRGGVAATLVSAVAAGHLAVSQAVADALELGVEARQAQILVSVGDAGQRGVARDPVLELGGPALSALLASPGEAGRQAAHGDALRAGS